MRRGRREVSGGSGGIRTGGRGRVRRELRRKRRHDGNVRRRNRSIRRVRRRLTRQQRVLSGCHLPADNGLGRRRNQPGLPPEGQFVQQIRDMVEFVLRRRVGRRHWLRLRLVGHCVPSCQSSAARAQGARSLLHGYSIAMRRQFTHGPKGPVYAVSTKGNAGSRVKSRRGKAGRGVPKTAVSGLPVSCCGTASARPQPHWAAECGGFPSYRGPWRE